MVTFKLLPSSNKFDSIFWISLLCLPLTQRFGERNFDGFKDRSSLQISGSFSGANNDIDDPFSGHSTEFNVG